MLAAQGYSRLNQTFPDYSLADDAMLAFLDHRLAGAPFVLCGTSAGGYLARAIAARRRARASD